MVKWPDCGANMEAVFLDKTHFWYDKGAWPNPLWNGLAWWFGQEGVAQEMSTPLSKSSPLANYIVP